MEWAVELIDWLVGNHAAGVVFVYMFTSLCWGSFPCNIEVPYWATLRFLTRQRWSSLSSNTEVSYKVALDLYLATLRFLYQTMLRFFTKVPCQATLRIFTWQCWGFLLGSVEALCLAALRLFAWQCWGSLPGSVEALCLAALRFLTGNVEALYHTFLTRPHTYCVQPFLQCSVKSVSEQWNTPQACNQTTSNLLHTCSVSTLKYNINPLTYY